MAGTEPEESSAHTLDTGTTPLEEVVIISAEEVIVMNSNNVDKVKKEKKEKKKKVRVQQPSTTGPIKPPPFKPDDPLIIKLVEIHTEMKKPDDRYIRFCETNYRYVRNWFIGGWLASAILLGIILPVVLYLVDAINLVNAAITGGCLIAVSGGLTWMLFQCFFNAIQLMCVKRILSNDFSHVNTLSTYTDLILSSLPDARFWSLMTKRVMELKISEIADGTTEKAQNAITRYGLLTNRTRLYEPHMVLSTATARLQGFDPKATDSVTLKKALLLFYKRSPLCDNDYTVPFY